MAGRTEIFFPPLPSKPPWPSFDRPGNRVGRRVASRWGWSSGAVPLGPHPHLRRLPPEQHVLAELERQAVLVYTPSRKVHGKRLVCYDDRYIVKVAYEQDGVIVSNDNYRDLQSENPEWKWFIEQRLLMFSFVNDRYGRPGRVGVRGRGSGHARLQVAKLGVTRSLSPADRAPPGPHSRRAALL